MTEAEMTQALEHDNKRKAAESLYPEHGRSPENPGPHPKTTGPERPPTFLPLDLGVKKVLAEGLLKDAAIAGDIAQRKFVEERKPYSAPQVTTHVPDVASLELPEGIRMMLFMPVVMGSDTFYTCQLHGFGHVTMGTSRSKQKSLAYALEEMARLVAG